LIGSILASDTIVNKCLKFIESSFSVKFTRKSYDNEKLKVFYKLSWLTGQPISVALVIMRKDYWHITHALTNENLRGVGYGTKLIENVLKQAKRAKINYVSCNIRTDNFTSQSFFQSLGFQKSTSPKTKPDFIYYSKDVRTR
jgi:ribosomal protein S18 acetylase RimI-like enzyme